MTRSALVTGATGLIGSYVVERLVADGWRVRSLVRDPSAARWLAAAGSELVPGDVLDGESFVGAARCDVIVHAAALVTARGSWEAFRRLNVDGTSSAICAAERNEARLVHVSSVAVYGAGERYRGSPTGEDTPLAPLRPGNHYGRSKRESEQRVLEAHDRRRIWATAVRPAVVYGRRDRQFVPRVARLLRHGVAPLIDGGRATLAAVHAANVADGIVRAASCEVAGGRAYNLANDFPVTVAEFVSLAASGLQRRILTPHLPLPCARAGIAVMSWLAALTHGSSLAAQARASLDFITRDNPFTSDRARHELGWQPFLSPHVGVPEAFSWWREHGGVS